jgi:inosine-uridine nucleoside N-ribohydrolase
MGRNIDAALALAMLFGLGRGRVIAVGVSHSGLEGAAFSDVIARFYGAGNLPIGFADDGPKLGASPMLEVPLGMRGEDGQPRFRHSIRSVIDTADPAVTFRNALLGQQEKQCIAVLAGPASNLARTLALPGARDIIEKRVRLLVMAAGAFGAEAVDARIRADIGSARKVLEDWPTPIVAVGVEAGTAAGFQSQNIDATFGAIPNHPVVSAFHADRDKQADAPVPAQAVLAALYAANPTAEYFKLSPPGTIDVAEDGRSGFRESPSGNHRLLIVETAQRELLAQAFVTMAGAKPPAGRGGPPRN